MNFENFKTPTLEDLKSVLVDLIDFVEVHRSLLDTNNVQFLVDNHWTNENILDKSLSADLENFLSNSKSKPANLIKYFTKLPDNECGPYPSLNSVFRSLKSLFKDWNDRVLTSEQVLLDSDRDDLIEFNSSVNEKFSVIERQNRFMKVKKSYEVDHMSKFVGTLCKKLDIYTMVDIGSGRAYLSAQLSSSIFENKFKVIAIDSSQNNVDSSLKRLDLMKRKTGVFEPTPTSEEKPDESFKTFSQFIQSSTELNNLIKENCENKIDENYGLIGLHSCGNLSNSIINLYLHDDKNENKVKRKLLCNVACCYNLLNEKYANDLSSGFDFKKTNIKLDDSSKFPMSFYLNEKKYSLSYNFRMLACHSLYRCFASIDEFKELNNSTLWYRTLLQLILYENFRAEFPVEKETEISLKVGRKLIDVRSMPEFVDYVRNVFKKFNLDSDRLSDEQISDYMRNNLHMKPKLDIYIQLKYLLAPIIEYIILLDRLIYLYEYDQLNLNHYLVKLFDQAKSPRCHALISFTK